MEIYKYQPISEYFWKNLINDELWFNNPRNFNDWYDSNLPLNIDYTRTEIEEFIKHSYYNNFGNLERFEEMFSKDIDRLSSNKLEREKYFKDITEHYINTEYGYGEKEIAQGKALYDTAAQMYETNKRETSEEALAYNEFSKKLEAFKNVYATDRKKAKIIYKEEPKILIALHIKGVAPLRTNKLLEDIEAFYKELKAKPDLLTPLNKLKITAEHIETQLTALADVKQAEATYVLERGESQQATKDKDAAFAAFEKWVREFYAIAKIALEDKPQLLESIGKFVRS